MNIKLYKRSVITKALSTFFCFSISSNLVSSFSSDCGKSSSTDSQKSIPSNSKKSTLANSQKPVSSNSKKSTLANSQKSISSNSKKSTLANSQKSVSSNSKKSTLANSQKAGSQNFEKPIPNFENSILNSKNHVISISRFEKFCNDIHESCEKYTNFYKSNVYDIRETWWRCIFARFRGGDLPSRMKESYEVFEKEGIHRISCWDSVLASYYNIINNGILKKHLNDEEIKKLKMGIVTYLIPVSLGLANHTFGYAYLDGYLFIYDVIDGIANEVIDFNFAYLPGAHKTIRKQIKKIYSRMSYTYMYNNTDKEIEKRYYSINAKLRKIFGMVGIENGEYGEMEMYFSECVFDNDRNVSNLRWMHDFEFFNYLLKHSWKQNDKFPPIVCFDRTNPGLMFA